MPELTRERLATALASAGLSALFANVPTICWLLLGAQIVDFVSGILAAGRSGEIDSHVGWMGLRRKALTWCIIAIAFVAEVALQRPAPIAELVTGFYLGIEGLSVVENAGRAGVPVPTLLRNALVKLRDQVEGGKDPAPPPPTVSV